MGTAAKATLLVGFALATPARAEPIVAVGLQTGVEHFDYAEKLQAPAKSSEHGFIATEAIEARTLAPFPVFARASLLFSYGPLTYDGSVQNTKTGAIYPATASTTHSMLQAEANIGYRHVEGDGALSLYVGVGHRSWKRDLFPSDGGYLETYSWSYVPIGAQFEIKIGELDLAIDGALLPAFSGRMVAELDALDPRIAPTETAPIAKMGVRLRIPLSYRIHEMFRLGVLLSYETSKLERSELATLRAKTGETFVDDRGNPLQIYEPSSTTTRLGVALTGTLVF